jgi:translation elongation factor EF-Tu-like GTPase
MVGHVIAQRQTSITSSLANQVEKTIRAICKAYAVATILPRPRERAVSVIGAKREAQTDRGSKSLAVSAGKAPGESKFCAREFENG